MILRTAFWNVETLFHWKAQHGRRTGPRSRDEYSAKLQAVREVMRRLFKPDLPDLLGLAEVGTEGVLEELLGDFGNEFRYLWVAPASLWGMRPCSN